MRMVPFVRAEMKLAAKRQLLEQFHDYYARLFYRDVQLFLTEKLR
jgi:hypothetical protein